MNSRKIKSLTSIILVLALMASNVSYINVNAEDNIGEEVIDEVVEDLVADDCELEDMEDVVYEDLEMLDSIGLDVNTIVDTTVNDEEEVVYDLELTDTITNEISVEKMDDGILMNAVEGEKENELLIQDDGRIYLDGKEVVMEEDTLEDEEYLEDKGNSDTNFTQSTGGWYWYESGKAPSRVKKAKYKPYPSKPTSKCSNIKLREAIGSVAISVLVAIFVTYITGGSGAITLSGTGQGALASIMSAFITYDPRTKNMSLKYYVANCKNNNRYRRKKCYIYSKKNYKGKKSTTIEYGIMM